MEQEEGRGKGEICLGMKVVHSKPITGVLASIRVSRITDIFPNPQFKNKFDLIPVKSVNTFK